MKKKFEAELIAWEPTDNFIDFPENISDIHVFHDRLFIFTPRAIYEMKRAGLWSKIAHWFWSIWKRRKNESSSK